MVAVMARLDQDPATCRFSMSHTAEAASPPRLHRGGFSGFTEKHGEWDDVEQTGCLGEKIDWRRCRGVSNSLQRAPCKPDLPFTHVYTYNFVN